jgi:5-methylcytosine-specific restriction endonuclease McrA
MVRKVRRNDKPEIRAAFAEEQTRCANCGSTRWLQTHHLLNGRFGRIDDRRNLLRLCEKCHRLAEGERVRDEYTKSLHPKLTLANCLALKQASDPKYFDMSWLRSKSGAFQIPEPEKVNGNKRGE